MTDTPLSLVKAALAALSQNATHPADIAYAKRCLRDAVSQLTPDAADEGEALAESELSNDELDPEYEVWANL